MFSLPKSVSYSLCGEWISLHSLGKVDTAVCNKTQRKLLLDVMSNDFFIVENTLISDRFVAMPSSLFPWLLHRSVKIRNLELSSLTFATDLPIVGDLSKIEKLTICCEKSKKLNSSIFFKKLLNLQRLTITAADETTIDLSFLDGSFIKNCADFPKNLEFFQINSTLVKDSAVCALLEYAGNSLTTLDLNNCASLKDESMEALTVLGKLITSLDLGYCSSISSDSVLRFIESHPALTELNLEDWEISNAVVEKIAKHCRSLRRLNLDFCKALSMTSLAQVFALCPQLERFVTIHYDYVAGVDISYSCPVAEGSAVRSGVRDGVMTAVSVVDGAAVCVTTHRVNKLTIKGSYTKDVVIQEIIAACPSDIHFFDLHECHKLTDATLIKVVTKYAHCLQVLDVSQCKLLTDAAMRHIASVAAHSLQFLNIDYCWQVTDGGIGVLIERCLALKRIRALRITTLSGDTVAAIERLSHSMSVVNL